MVRDHALPGVGVRHFGAFAALELLAPEVATAARPGQFVMVTVPGGGFLLRRPLSLYTARGDRVGLLVEASGAGSARLAAAEWATRSTSRARSGRRSRRGA